MTQMLDWISDHSAVLQVALNAIMVVIWMLYLQAFLTGFRRQRRPEILISLGAGVGPKAYWFVANLGLEPIYIVDVIVQLETDSGMRETVVTDRTEFSGSTFRSPAEATNHGPLQSGGFMSIGNRQTILDRAHPPDCPDSEIRSITILVVAATAASRSIVGASRGFRFATDAEGRDVLMPTSIDTKQILGRGGRQLRRKLERSLQCGDAYGGCRDPDQAARPGGTARRTGGHPALERSHDLRAARARQEV